LNKNSPKTLEERAGRFAITVTVLSLLVLLLVTFAQPIQRASAQIACSLSQLQPADPVDMNSVIFKTLVKTVHLEKEVYSNCRGIVPSVLDVNTYTEIREDLSSFPTIVPKVSFELITCSKNIVTGSVDKCQQLVPSIIIPSVSSCSQRNVAFPIEMNTITSPDGIVKTIESQKEVFSCKVTGAAPVGFGSTAIKEVTIFTEIFEGIVHGKTVKMSQSTTCIKPFGPALLTSKTISCHASKASVIPL
jgi:hypothetical protein